MLLVLLACGGGERLAVEGMALNPLHHIDRNVDRAPHQAHVDEVVAAGSYMYVRTDEPRWVVGLAKPLEVGDPVEISAVGRAEHFESARTGRVFDTLWFAVITPGG